MLHILVVAFQAEGHVNGILRLAQSLAAREAVVVTFGYPAHFYNLALKRNQLAPLLSSPSVRDSKLRIRVVEDGLAPVEEQSLTLAMIGASMPIFQQNVKLLLDELLGKPPAAAAPDVGPPSCIISDTFAPWTQDLANAAHITRVDFWTSTAAVYSMGSQLGLLVSEGILPLHRSCWEDPETKWSVNAPLIEGVPGLPPFPATDLCREFVRAEELTEPDLQFMLAAFSRVREAHSILVHSVYELERPVFDALQATGLPIRAVGPLSALPTPITSPGVDTVKHECLRWLDTQPPSSVIYIALGSVFKLTPSEMHALALALEASKHPFLWVIRSDSVSSSSLADALPAGFRDRTVNRGSGLIISWAPQTQVLSHPSTGGFFSHCGWNSTFECMWEGIPMVACPRGAEQRSNARWIVDTWKIGVALDRKLDGSFTQEAVEKALRQLFSKECKAQFSERTSQVKEVARRALKEGGSSDANLESFIQSLRHAQSFNR